MTNSQETITFTDFMLSDALLILERDRPDTSGARKVILSFEVISLVKLTVTTDLQSFSVMGFRPQ